MQPLLLEEEDTLSTMSASTPDNSLDNMSHSPPSTSSASASAPRRPPRKSTLTQQQKNQKRQRATQEQLVVLEAEFSENPTPTAHVRERIADKINMTERSVQIWFQNRRAKIKTMAKKSIEAGEDYDYSISDSMRQYLANQAMESGKGFVGFFDRQRLSSSYGNGSMMMAHEPQHQSKIIIHHFNCRSLSIGTWRRVGQNTMDLVVFYSPEQACLTYYINNDSAGYKIEYPFASIKSIELETHDLPLSAANGQKQGQLVISLSRPPNFFMDSSGHGGFFQCGDFTQDQQATQVLTHYLGGPPKILAGQLAKLVTVDAFVNRHSNAPALYEQPLMANVTMSAPVSPHIVRPASSNDVPAWPPQDVAPGHKFHLKHRRTRSRSVPAGHDFSLMQANMPSFNFHNHHHHHHHVQDGSSSSGGGSDGTGHLYAPAPMHPHALAVNAPSDGPLRIDTSSDLFDYHPSGSAGYPLSATTTASPSEYASPSMLNSALHHDPDGYGPPYNVPFLSPLQGGSTTPTTANGMGPSTSSPILLGSDPIIASGSPPLTCDMDRSGSTELFLSPYDERSLFPEQLSEMYSKQTLSLSMAVVHDSPHHLEGATSDDVEMQHLMQHFPQSMAQSQGSAAGLSI